MMCVGKGGTIIKLFIEQTKAGKNITMHFNFNEELNLFDDFKIK